MEATARGPLDPKGPAIEVQLMGLLDKIEKIITNPDLTDSEKVETVHEMILVSKPPAFIPDKNLEQAYLMARLINLRPRGLIN